MTLDWVDIAIFVGVLVPSVILHEVAHGALALVLGDDTAKRAGRLTLNPVRHVDPVGSLLLPAMLVAVGLNPFGYAKPVPVNPRALRDPRRHSLWVSLVGPGVNIALALFSVVLVRVLLAAEVTGLTLEIALAFGIVNVVLAVFNLIPVPPLDGSAMVERILPVRWWPGWLKVRQYAPLVLLVVLLARPGVLGAVFQPAVDLWYDALA